MSHEVGNLHLGNLHRRVSFDCLPLTNNEGVEWEAPVLTRANSSSNLDQFQTIEIDEAKNLVSGWKKKDEDSSTETPPTEPPKEEIFTLGAKRQKFPEFDRDCCVSRVVKRLFWNRIGQTSLICGIAIGVLAIAVAFLYQYGLLQQALNAMPFLNVSIGPALNSIWLPSIIGSSIFTGLMGTLFMIDIIRHWNDPKNKASNLFITPLAQERITKP